MSLLVLWILQRIISSHGSDRTQAKLRQNWVRIVKATHIRYCELLSRKCSMSNVLLLIFLILYSLRPRKEVKKYSGRGTTWNNEKTFIRTCFSENLSSYNLYIFYGSTTFGKRAGILLFFWNNPTQFLNQPIRELGFI